MTNKTLLTITGVTTAATATSVPVAVASDASGGSNKQPQQSLPVPVTRSEIIAQKPNWANQLVENLDSSTDVKKKHEKIYCLEKYKGDGTEWEDSSKDNNNPQLTLASEDIESCLVVEYYSQEHSPHGWIGELKLVWSLGNDSQGFVTSFNAKAENGKLSMDYAAYVLTKSQQKWTISHKQENLKKEITKKSELAGWFPEHGGALKLTEGLAYWGLDPEPEKICKSKCARDVASSPVWNSTTWEIKKENTRSGKLHEWNKDFSSWFGNLFPGWINIKTKILDLKGDWKKKWN